MKYKIVCKNDKVSKKVCDELKKIISKEETNNPDVIFSIGGDGTFLDAVRMHLDVLDQVYFISIHTGTLGVFIQSFYHMNLNALSII